MDSESHPKGFYFHVYKSTLQTLTGMYRDLTGIRMDRDNFVTVFDCLPAIHVVHDDKLTGIICYNNNSKKM